jgi:hypothetical protein
MTHKNLRRERFAFGASAMVLAAVVEIVPSMPGADDTLGSLSRGDVGLLIVDSTFQHARAQVNKKNLHCLQVMLRDL